MSLLLCIYVGASPRQAAKAVEVVAFMFNGLLGGAPCHTTIRTWLAKMGIDTMKHKNIDITQAYALILDASISVNDQQLLLALKCRQTIRGKPLHMQMRRLSEWLSPTTGLQRRSGISALRLPQSKSTIQSTTLQITVII